MEFFRGDQRENPSGFDHGVDNAEMGACRGGEGGGLRGKLAGREASPEEDTFCFTL